MTDLATFEARLRLSLGNIPAGQVSADQLYVVINSAHTFLLDRIDHRNAQSWFTFDTSANVANYSIPLNYGPILKVFHTVLRRAIRQTNKDQIPYLANLPIGVPRYYNRSGSLLTLYPTPDRVYVIGAYGKIKISPMVLPSDVSLLDATWDDGIVKRARYEFFDTFGEPTKAALALASFNEWISTKPTTAIEELRDLDMGSSMPQLERFAAEQDSTTHRFTVPNNWTNEAFPE